MSPTAKKKIYQLKITLKEFKPPIWRRILIASDTGLPDASLTFLISMGWTNTHLHEFVSQGMNYSIPDPDWPDQVDYDEEDFRLHDLLKKEKDRLEYNYDFGDDWRHLVVLEKILPLSSKTKLPFCIKAAGACPPEDVGGVFGYYDFLEAMADENHESHKDVIEWYGDKFDPNDYDIEVTNELLDEYIK